MTRLFVLTSVVCISTFFFAPDPCSAGDQQTSHQLLAERPSRDIRVVMYMTPWWPYCRKAREYLEGLGVTLTEHDVEKDDLKRTEMKRLSGGSTTVPLIDIEGIIIRGYVPGEMKAAVEQRRKRSI